MIYKKQKVPKIHKKKKKQPQKKEKYEYNIPPPPLRDITLQQILGNQEVQRMFQASEIMAKLFNSQPGDIYEKEADRIAKRIVIMGDKEVQLKTSEIKIQKKGASLGGESVSSQTEAGISSLKGKGQPFEPKIRDYFQPRFGVDLKDVRVHTDSNADRLARAIRAKAFTLGNDMVFAKGEYKPETHEGKKLVAHELTHVLQQKGNKKNKTVHRDKGNTEILNKLGQGNPLDTQTKIRMGSAFGRDFSHVRIHTDHEAGQLASKFNAKAFTVGNHIALDKKEYKPGTIIGDALLAHELAHTIQQKDAVKALNDTSYIKSNNMDTILEKDADKSVFSVMLQLWDKVKQLPQKILPRLKSGITLQKCSKTLEDPSKMSDTQIESTTEYQSYMDPAKEWQTRHRMTREEALLASRLIIRARIEGRYSNWQSEANTYFVLARGQLGALSGVQSMLNMLEWVGFNSGHAVIDPLMLESEFGKWLLANGPEPSFTTGKINCWEVILFGAYKAGFTTRANLQNLYNTAVANVSSGTFTSVGDTVENALRASQVYTYTPGDPDSPRPLRGDMVVFDRAANHAAIALGNQTGEVQILSLWVFNNRKVEITTVETLIRAGAPANIKFWSVKW